MGAADSCSNDEIGGQVGEPRSTNRRMRARGSATQLSITSDIGDSEPVTDAEVRLIMAGLGNIIAEILNTSTSE
jgi:hypothetical protein